MLIAPDDEQIRLPDSRTPDLVAHEIARLGAPPAEIEFAFDFVASESAFDAPAYEALSPRLRRLVDLIRVAGPAPLGTAEVTKPTVEGLFEA